MEFKPVVTPAGVILPLMVNLVISNLYETGLQL